MRHRFAEHFAERLLKSSYNQLLNSHDSVASHIAKCGYSLSCPPGSSCVLAPLASNVDLWNPIRDSSLKTDFRVVGGVMQLAVEQISVFLKIFLYFYCARLFHRSCCHVCLCYTNTAS